MNTTPPGTELFKTLSLMQRTILACAWVVYIGGLFVFAPTLSDFPVLFIAIVIGGAMLIFVISFRIQQRASGGKRIRITRAEGMCGEFSIRRSEYRFAFIIGFPLGIVGAGKLFTNPQTSLAELVFGVSCIALFVVTVINYLRSVNRFRADENGSVWFKRVWGTEWYPLYVADFQRVEGRVTANRPHWRQWDTLQRVAAIWFRDPVEGSRSIYIAIEWVMSRQYKTTVSPRVVENYFIEKCKQTEYVVDDTRRSNVAWTARPSQLRSAKNHDPHRWNLVQS